MQDSTCFDVSEPDEDVMGNTESMTTMLKIYKADFSTVKANKTLVALGLLSEEERPSAKYAGKMKKYKALTESGLQYGINVENPNSPGQTTPHYFIDSFERLLVLIQQKITRES